MLVSRDNNKLFLAVVLGIFLTSGCSGHTVKYGSNSEGDGMGSEDGMMAESGENGMGRNPDGSLSDAGTVDGANPYFQSGQGGSNAGGDMTSQVDEGSSPYSGSQNGADYGQEYGGVDGSGPNHGSVTGFGSGSANATNPDPEAWANAYLREKRSSPEFYGDSPAKGSSYGHENDGAPGVGANYGHDYDGVSGSGPNYGAVDGFSQGSAAPMGVDPETWAQTYLNENGGASPEYVNPDMTIAQAPGMNDSSSMGLRDANGEIVEISNTSRSVEGRVQDIYFSFDSWAISEEGARYLKEDAEWLRANPDKGLTIEGHCDQRGTQDYNLVLGKKRAEAARDYLVNLGIQPHRIKIVSYGKERPFCQNNNEACFQENRRNHMVVRMNQS